MIAPLVFALLSPQLDAILDVPDLKGANYGVIVTDLDGKVLYERNADLHVMPASNQKLISCAYALATLGPDYRAQTKIWKLRDRVVVESNGDPSLTYAQLAEARKTLRLNGRQPVYVKQAYRVGVPESWEVDDLPNRYAAKVSAFTFDQSAFEIWAKKGKPELRPSAFGVKLVHDATLGPGKTDYDPLKKIARYGDDLPQAETRLDTLALPEPDEAAASVLGKKFIPTDKAPDRAPDLVIEGKPLKEILKTCLVNSDNNMAENFMLMASAKLGDIHEDPYKFGRARVEKFLTQTVGIDPTEFHYFDGSGMSRHNFVTARTIAKLLAWANRQPTAPLWKSCLVSPMNGTLKRRLEGVDFHGKTGTLDMVVALSGYVRTKQGVDLISSVVLNQFNCSSAKARDIADNFTKSLYESNDGISSALSCRYEARSSDSRTARPHRYRADRPLSDGNPSRPGQDRRVEPAHAGVYRTQ